VIQLLNLLFEFLTLLVYNIICAFSSIIVYLINNATSETHTIEHQINEGMIIEWRIGKGLEGSGHGVI
jgi:hypothetical protein